MKNDKEEQLEEQASDIVLVSVSIFNHTAI